MQTTARVVAVERGYATIEVERRSACDDCHRAEGGCAMCALIGEGKTLRARARNPVGAAVGDSVLVETASSRVLGDAALVFLCPIVLALIGYLLGGAVGAGVGFCLALIAAVLVSRARSGRTDITILCVTQPNQERITPPRV